jgi:ribosomal protein S18 acetylase RimI-like enzyme
MTEHDKPAIMSILKITPEFTPPEVVVAEEVIDCYLQDVHNSGYYALVAEADARVVGYVCYGDTPLTTGTWDIYWIAVAPKKQGLGIGRDLLASAEAEIRESDGRLVLVETSSKPGYERTRTFYHSQGYEVVSRIPDFYAPGDDRLTFQKRLR